ncbi:hypothetical protein [Emticicia oligotrophica]|nr:hypothetical protein [Emticicia oligotrophica]
MNSNIAYIINPIKMRMNLFLIISKILMLEYPTKNDILNKANE